MKVIDVKGIHYPVEHLYFQCRNNEEAKKYLSDNEVWTKELSKYPGFVSTTTMINESKNGEVQIIIVWETLDDWLAIPKEELISIANKFDKKFNLPYQNGKRIHNETNFGIYKVRHYEVRE